MRFQQFSGLKSDVKYMGPSSSEVVEKSTEMDEDEDRADSQADIVQEEQDVAASSVTEGEELGTGDGDQIEIRYVCDQLGIDGYEGDRVVIICTTDDDQQVMYSELPDATQEYAVI